MDNRNNLIKLEARKLIVESILSKVYSTITYDNETVSYSDLIEKQSKNLVNVLLDNGKFNGFYLRWWGNQQYFSLWNLCPQIDGNNCLCWGYIHGFLGNIFLKMGAKMLSSQSFLIKKYKIVK